MNGNAAELERILDAKNRALVEHPYFRRCRSGQITRVQLLDVVKQLYCFSVFFERILARRLASYSSTDDARVIDLARLHMRAEMGHAQMFRDCLVANGFATSEVDALVPRMFTKAMYGYLTVTVLHENEYVSNVAILQVMESIGFHFFGATLEVMKKHEMCAEALVQHAEDDQEHARLGLDLATDFDRATMDACRRVIDELYRLMEFVLDDWLPPVEARGTLARPARAERSLDPTT